MYSQKELFKIGFGPSSSHTMGPAFATSLFLRRYPDAEQYQVTLYASLACTGRGHLTDEIIYKMAGSQPIEIKFDYTTKVDHPNTMDFIAYNQDKIIGSMRALSVGGGSVKIQGEKSRNKKHLYPFKSFNEIKEYAASNNLTLAEIAYKFDYKYLRKYLLRIWDIMKKSIENGLSKDEDLPGELHVKRKAKHLYELKIEGESEESRYRRLVSSFAFAVNEENASGGIIVTAPTCGASGCLPAVLKYFQLKYKYTDQNIADALAVAGLIGNVIKTNASISGAEAGCQVEVGSACAMSAAAIAHLQGLTIDQIEYAAEMSLEHHLGLTCDPIKGYVQVPCIERNAVAALRAIDAAYLSRLLEQSHIISFDLVVQTMYETGKDIHERYRETSEGGLAKFYKVS